MAQSQSHAKERPTRNQPTHCIRCEISAAATVYLTAYRAQYVSGRPRQQRQLSSAMERVKRWELAQIEINKKDNTKLTPLPLDTKRIILYACYVRSLCMCLVEFPCLQFSWEIRNPRTWEKYRVMHLVYIPFILLANSATYIGVGFLWGR